MAWMTVPSPHVQQVTPEMLSAFDNNQLQQAIYNQAQKRAAAAQNVQAPVVSPTNVAPASTYNASTAGAVPTFGGSMLNLGLANGNLGNEMQLQQLLGQSATGGGPALSAAQEQLQGATQQNLSQLAGSAASSMGAGVSPGLAMQQLLSAQAGANQNAALGSAQLLTQGEQNAQGQLASLSPTIANQLIGEAQSNQAARQAAGLQTQQLGAANNQFNANALNTAGQFNAGAINTNQLANAGYANAASQANAANFLQNQNQQNQYTLGQEGVGTTNAQNISTNQQAGVAAQLQQANQQATDSLQAHLGSEQLQGQVAGAIAGAAGTAGAAAITKSDEKVKKDITSADPEIQKFLDAISAKMYEYKDPNAPGAGAGKFVSPMAQDLQKSAIGNSMVQNTPTGKVVDYGHGMGVMLAALAHMNDRINQLAR